MKTLAPFLRFTVGHISQCGLIAFAAQAALASSTAAENYTWSPVTGPASSRPATAKPYQASTYQTQSERMREPDHRRFA